MKTWYKTSGWLHYSSSGWLVVHLDLELQRYYHYILQKELNCKLNRPKFGCHITVVAGKYEQVQTHPAWNKHHQTQIWLEYYSPPKELDGTFWLECKNEPLTSIRNELGLSDIPKWPFHITIANRKNLN